MIEKDIVNKIVINEFLVDVKKALDKKATARAPYELDDEVEIMQISAGGDSINSIYLNEEFNKYDSDFILDYFTDNGLEIYEASDGDYLGEVFSIIASYSDDKQHIVFRKVGRREYSNSDTTTIIDDNRYMEVYKDKKASKKLIEWANKTKKRIDQFYVDNKINESDDKYDLDEIEINLNDISISEDISSPINFHIDNKKEVTKWINHNKMYIKSYYTYNRNSFDTKPYRLDYEKDDYENIVRLCILCLYHYFCNYEIDDNNSSIYVSINVKDGLCLEYRRYFDTDESYDLEIFREEIKA